MDIAAAVQRTLDAGTARVHLHSYVDPPRNFTYDYEGVTDFQLRRTRVTITPGPWLDDLLRRASERYRWFGDYTGPELPDQIIVYAGTASFTLSGEFCHAHGGQVWAPERHPSDPVHIVEQLTGLGPVFKVGNRTGEVWLDEEGRIARVLWFPVARIRPRAPWPWIVKTRHWHDLRLTDYGVNAEIPIPAATR